LLLREARSLAFVFIVSGVSRQVVAFVFRTRMKATNLFDTYLLLEVYQGCQFT